MCLCTHTNKRMHVHFNNWRYAKVTFWCLLLNIFVVSFQNFINVFCLHLETNQGSQDNQFMWNAANLIFKRNHCTLSLNRTVWFLCAHKHGISLKSNDGLPHICVHPLILHGHRVLLKYHLEYNMISYHYLNLLDL